MKEIVLIYFW